MQTASGAFIAAVGAADQLVEYRVTVTLPGSVSSAYQDLSRCVVSLNIPRKVTTAYSDQASLISGIPTAVATITLAGMLNQAAGVPLNEAQTAYWLMNALDPSSPMWGTTRGNLPVKIEQGYWDGGTAAEFVTIYTGTTDLVACSNGTVTITCRDQRSTITNQASLPPVITPAPYNSGLTSEFAVDYLFRHASPSQYYSWPALRSKCVLAASMRASTWSEVGTLISSDFEAGVSFAPGIFGTALGSALPIADLVTGVNAFYKFAAPIKPTDSIFLEFFATGGADNFGIELSDVPVGSGPQLDLQLSINFFGFQFRFSQAGSTVAVFTVSGLLNSAYDGYVGVQLTWPSGSTAISGTIYYNTTTTPFSATASAARSGSTQLNYCVLGCVDSTIEGFQLTAESAGSSSWNNTFVPTLILDPSLNPLTALPDVTGQDVWSVGQDIAAAEAAVLMFDELGLLRFVNRETIAAKTSTRTVTSAQSLITLDSQEQMSLCATHIQVPVSPLTIQPFSQEWTSPDAVMIGPGQTFRTVADTGSILALGTACGIVPSGGLVTPGTSGYRAARQADGTGGAISNLTMTVQQLSAAAVAVTVVNPNSFTVYLVSPTGAGFPSGSDGGSSLAIGGQAVVAGGTTTDGTTDVNGGSYADSQWPPIADGGAAANPTFGEILYQAPSSPWRQDGVAAQSLADHLLSDMHYPKVLLRNVSVIADPRAQLLDAITIQDPDVSQMSDDVLTLGITTRLSAGEWTQDMDLLMLSRPGAWTLGVSTLGVDNILY